MTPLVDSHVHLDDNRFDADREAVIERAKRSGVRTMVVPAVDASGWAALAQLAETHTGICPAYGMHPMFLACHRPEDVDRLDAWLDAHPAVAVGETGLDHFVASLDHERQLALFERHLAIAVNHRLPVIVHARRAVDAVIGAIRRHPGVRGVVHSFSGSLEQAIQLDRLGFFVGIGGPLTHARAQRLHRIFAQLPIEQIVLESDAPDQPGAMHRGQRNEPAWIADTANALAALRGMGVDEVARSTTANAGRLFGFGLPDN
ncbi:MAG: TatD family hydrolase [Xanthomonadaceae bacterium]|nr:TatD family hydrolase [Xanthomonadaceae bacterium]